MTSLGALAPLTPAQRAEVIYAEAQSTLSDQLWRAALGDPQDHASDPPATNVGGGLDLGTLLALNERDDPVPAAAVPNVPAARLGANEGLRGAIDRAAARTGIPAATLAAIVNAEAGADSSGQWNVHARNGRSSAVGLGQFLTGTWIGMAERSGTWLNALATSRGWLESSGHVEAAARADLLALREDGEAAINTVADYARANLDQLRRAGLDFGGDAAAQARAAYLGHYLGAGDAVRFLTGRMDGTRAASLLSAQVGSAAAQSRIAAAGGAVEAHRAWIESYMARHLEPGRFAAL